MTGSSNDRALLAIYLNDHLAGAVIGVNLAGRLAASEDQWAGGDVLRKLASEVAADRAALVDMMSALEVPVRRYKTWAAWAAERAGRFKLNGRLLERSPLSRVLELEGMRLAVEGKTAGWRTLRAHAASDARLDVRRLDELIKRAEHQIEQLERLRIRAAAEVFSGQSAATDDGRN